MRALVIVVLIACGNRSEPRKAPEVSGSAVAALPKGTPIELAPKAKRVFGDGPRHADSVEMVAFSADGSRLASVDRDGGVFVWDVATGKPIASSHTDAYRQFVAFAGAEVVTKAPADLRMVTASSDGRWIFAELDHGIGLYELATGRRAVIEGPKPSWISIAHDTLAVIAEDQSVSAGPLAGPRTPIADATRGTYVATVSPDGKRIAMAGKDGEITIHPSGKRIRVEGLDEDRGTSVLAWSPDGTQLAISVGARTVTLVDTRTGSSREIAEEVFGNDITFLTFSPDGARIAGGTKDGRVRLWDAKTGAVLHAHAGHIGSTWDVAVSADGGTLASAGDEHVLVWTPAMAAYGDHERSITVIAVSPDGTRLASCSDGDVNVRELPTGTIIAKLQLPHMECESLAIIGDQLIGATGNAAHIVPIEDGAKPRTIALSAGRKYGTSAFAVSPDGSLLAGGGDDGQIAVHSADGTRRWGATMPKDPNEENERYTVRALAFDDTGTQLAAVTDDDNLRLYDARTGRVLRTQPVTLASGWLTSVAFMGTRVAVGASSGEVFVIDAQGKIVFTANQTIGGIFALAATKTRLFTGGESGDVVEWDVP